MAIFGENHVLTPLEKCQFFRLFELLVFIASKRVFPLQNIVRDIFLTYIAQKKNLEKWPFLDQNHGLTPLEKCQFLDFLNFLLLQPIKTFFRQKIVKDIFLAYIAPPKNIWKNGHFFNQSHGLTPLKKREFFEFLNSFF